MQRVHVIAHTIGILNGTSHVSMQRVQFAYHMEEVLQALTNNQLDAYLLDGQMAIIDDYLQTNPDKRDEIRQLVQARRLLSVHGIPD